MVLDKDYVKKKYIKNAAAPIPRLVCQDGVLTPSSDLGSNNSEYTYSTSAIANSETDSLTPQGTLSMVSTPWTTESWNTYTITEEESLERSILSWLSTDEPASSVTLAPATTTSYGVSTAFNSDNSSKQTLTLLSGMMSPSESYQIPLVNRKSQMSGSVSTWTMETYTSTGILSDANTLRVNYPWSPCTTAMSSEIYPSSVESYESRKVSRVSVPGTPNERDSLTPMNYTLLGKQDKDPVVDWLLMKLKGLGIVRVRV